jgi:hypothetical protein
VQQAPGRAFAAQDVTYAADDRQARLSLDLARAYPPEAGIDRWRRSVRLTRGEGLVIEDVFALHDGARAITLGLLTPCEVDLASGQVTFRETAFGPEPGTRVSGTAVLTYEVDVAEVWVERVVIDDARLGGVWGDHLNRVCFRAVPPVSTGTWRWRVTA